MCIAFTLLEVPNFIKQLANLREMEQKLWRRNSFIFLSTRNFFKNKRDINSLRKNYDVFQNLPKKGLNLQ